MCGCLRSFKASISCTILFTVCTDNSFFNIHLTATICLQLLWTHNHFWKRLTTKNPYNIISEYKIGKLVEYLQLGMLCRHLKRFHFQFSIEKRILAPEARAFFYLSENYFSPLRLTRKTKFFHQSYCLLKLEETVQNFFILKAHISRN